MNGIKRKQTQQILIGNVPIGGGEPIVVQSMTKTDTRDVSLTSSQINHLEEAGCEIIRVAVPDNDAAISLGKIKKQIHIPIIADIHFDWKIALESINQGVDGLRINPGNIGAEWKVKEIVSACNNRGIPIRIGVNAGSLKKDILKKYGHPTPEAIVDSAERHIEILENLGFSMIKVSLKASNVPTTIDAYRLFSERYDYPLHIGISEAGPSLIGIIKSSVGLGILLNEGIGDTLRVSLTADPLEEVKVAYEILKSLSLRQKGANLISCPTCGRTQVNIMELASKVEERLDKLDKHITVAVMGCVVNGPGEAREADYGIAGGKSVGLLFKKGEIVKKLKESELLDALMDMIELDEISESELK